MSRKIPDLCLNFLRLLEIFNLIMDITQCLKILNVNRNASDAEITAAYRKMAMKYHPDRNRQDPGKAHEAMTLLNTAYSILMSSRFRDPAGTEAPEKKKSGGSGPGQKHEEKVLSPEEKEKQEDLILKKFIRLREAAKEELYKFFQYSLYNLHRRETAAGESMFRRIVLGLRKAYHGIGTLSEMTDDPEFTEHFSVFRQMIFDFYRASECLNINTACSDMTEAGAWRMYRNGEDHLTAAMKELFYERHNRGFMKGEFIAFNVVEAENLFQDTLNLYPASGWTVEAGIKLDFTRSLKRYMTLFFS